jgi:hypothetical protein
VNGHANIRQLFEDFEKMFRQMKETIIVSREGRHLRFHFSRSSHMLSGVDFDEISSQPNRWSITQVEIKKNNSGGWEDMVKGKRIELGARVGAMLVFFCCGLDDPIRPATAADSCSHGSSTTL